MEDKKKQDGKGKNKERRPFKETLGRPQTPPPQPKDYEEIEY
jgi:hypothetical protein